MAYLRELREKREEAERSGLELGIKLGEAIGAIRVFEQLLQRPQTPREQLHALSPDDLARLKSDLEAQVFQKNK